MIKHYSLRNILKYNAKYNMIIGERSNGKTFAVQEYMIKRYMDGKGTGAIIRRYDTDFVGKRGRATFGGVNEDGDIKKWTRGLWTDIYYFSSAWYLCRYEDDTRITDPTPFCYGFALSAMEHDKSTNYPTVTTILFDEFISRTYYLQDEFVIYMNVLSTIIRHRDDVTIFMLGNTVNKYCPYFKEMGLRNVPKMLPGTIDLYQYGESGLTVAVEHTKPTQRGKKSDLYFAFDNPRLQMITGGVWELDLYPHSPYKIERKNIIFQFYVEFDGNIIVGDIITHDVDIFIHFHPKTSPLKARPHDLIYSTEVHPAPNYAQNILKPVNHMQQRIFNLLKTDKIFFSDNETGEVFHNYCKWCVKKS